MSQMTLNYRVCDTGPADLQVRLERTIEFTIERSGKKFTFAKYITADQVERFREDIKFMEYWNHHFVAEAFTQFYAAVNK